MQMHSPLPPPGWLPDPEDSTRVRYWNGSEWTPHRAVRSSGPSSERFNLRKFGLAVMGIGVIIAAAFFVFAAFRSSDETTCRYWAEYGSEIESRQPDYSDCQEVPLAAWIGVAIGTATFLGGVAVWFAAPKRSQT